MWTDVNIHFYLIHALATRPCRLKDKNPGKAKTTWQDRAAEIQGRGSGKYQAVYGFGYLPLIWSNVRVVIQIQCELTYMCLSVHSQWHLQCSLNSCDNQTYKFCFFANSGPGLKDGFVWTPCTLVLSVKPLSRKPSWTAQISLHRRSKHICVDLPMALKQTIDKHLMMFKIQCRTVKQKNIESCTGQPPPNCMEIIRFHQQKSCHLLGHQATIDDPFIKGK